MSNREDGLKDYWAGSNRYSTVKSAAWAIPAQRLGFATAGLAYNALSLLKRCVEQAHQEKPLELDVSTDPLAVQVARDYPGMLIALPAPEWHLWSEATPERVAQYLLPLASQVSPRRVATCKRGPKKDQSKPDVDAAVVRKHLSTARVLRDAKVKTP